MRKKVMAITIQPVHSALLLIRTNCLQLFRNVRPSEMARKNGVTSDAIFDTPVIVENQSCGLPVLPNGLVIPNPVYKTS